METGQFIIIGGVAFLIGVVIGIRLGIGYIAKSIYESVTKGESKLFPKVTGLLNDLIDEVIMKREIEKRSAPKHSEFQKRLAEMAKERGYAQ